MTRKSAIAHLAHKITGCKTCGESWADNVNVVALEMAVEAMARPVIGNCKNCKWCEEIAGDKYVCNYQNSIVLGSYVEPDFYCKYWAERTKQ